jgi:hypothetical protein
MSWHIEVIAAKLAAVREGKIWSEPVRTRLSGKV